jgi:hypothetical protein
LLLALQASAQISDLESGEGASYYYTDHFEVMIDKPLAEVWPLVLDLGGWMPYTEEFATSGPVSEGQVIKLYGDFHIEITKIIPGQMLIIVNLPTSQEGEDTQGIAMVNVKAVGDRTQVSLFMSRIYTGLSRRLILCGKYAVINLLLKIVHTPIGIIFWQD